MKVNRVSAYVPHRLPSWWVLLCMLVFTSVVPLVEVASHRGFAYKVYMGDCDTQLCAATRVVTVSSLQWLLHSTPVEKAREDWAPEEPQHTWFHMIAYERIKEWRRQFSAFLTELPVWVSDYITYRAERDGLVDLPFVVYRWYYPDTRNDWSFMLDRLLAATVIVQVLYLTWYFLFHGGETLALVYVPHVVSALYTEACTGDLNDVTLRRTLSMRAARLATLPIPDSHATQWLQNSVDVAKTLVQTRGPESGFYTSQHDLDHLQGKELTWTHSPLPARRSLKASV